MKAAARIVNAATSRRSFPSPRERSEWWGGVRGGGNGVALNRPPPRHASLTRCMSALPTASRWEGLAGPASMKANSLPLHADLFDHRLPQRLLLADVGEQFCGRHRVGVARDVLEPLLQRRIVQHDLQVLVHLSGDR